MDSHVFMSAAGQLGIGSSSSRKLKENIQSIVHEVPERLDALTRLNPVRFNFKNDITKSPDYGLIAEEVYEHMPELILYNAKGQIHGVRYHVLPALLLAEIIRMKKMYNSLLDRVQILECKSNN